MARIRRSLAACRSMETTLCACAYSTASVAHAGARKQTSNGPVTEAMRLLGQLRHPGSPALIAGPVADGPPLRAPASASQAAGHGQAARPRRPPQPWARARRLGTGARRPRMPNRAGGGLPGWRRGLRPRRTRWPTSASGRNQGEPATEPPRPSPRGMRLRRVTGRRSAGGTVGISRNWFTGSGPWTWSLPLRWYGPSTGWPICRN